MITVSQRLNPAGINTGMGVSELNPVGLADTRAYFTVVCVIDLLTLFEY